MKPTRTNKTNTQHREENSERSRLRAEILRRVVSRHGYKERFTLADARREIARRAQDVIEDTARNGSKGRIRVYSTTVRTKDGEQVEHTPAEGYTSGTYPLTNTNPQYDLGQRVFERREAKLAERETTYRETAYAKACAFADAHVRRSRIPCSHLRREFVTEAESAIGEFIATVETKYPKLGCNCLAKFALNAWGHTLRRRLAAHVHRSLDKVMRRMAKTDTVEPAFFLAILGEEGNKHDEDRMRKRIRKQVADLVAKVVTNGAVSKTKARAAGAHLAFLAHAEQYLLASIDGVNTKPFANELRKGKVTHAGKLTVRDSKGRIRKTETTETSESVGDLRASQRILWNRIQRLRTFVGGFGESSGRVARRDPRNVSEHGYAARNPAFVA